VAFDRVLSRLARTAHDAGYAPRGAWAASWRVGETGHRRVPGRRTPSAGSWRLSA